jgi:hypothetical protein
MTIGRSTSSDNNNTEIRGNTSTQREKLGTFMRIINCVMYTLAEKKKTEKKKNRKKERQKDKTKI